MTTEIATRAEALFAKPAAKVEAPKKPITAAKPTKEKKAAPQAGEQGPCAIAQAFADANPKMTRAELVAALAAQGIHKATAHIQTTKADRKAGRERAKK